MIINIYTDRNYILIYKDCIVLCVSSAIIRIFYTRSNLWSFCFVIVFSLWKWPLIVARVQLFQRRPVHPLQITVSVESVEKPQERTSKHLSQRFSQIICNLHLHLLFFLSVKECLIHFPQVKKKISFISYCDKLIKHNSKLYPSIYSCNYIHTQKFWAHKLR